MNKLTPAYSFVNLKAAIAADTNWKNCQVIEYTTTAAIGTQYAAGVALYDFAKNDYQGGKTAMVAKAADKLKADEFLQLVWKSSTSAGFAKTSAGSVGMYCPKATDTVAQFATNVGAKCVGSNKVNTCFNAVQRAAANAKRKLHGAVPLADDPAAGSTLQGKLDGILTATWKKGDVDLPKETATLAKPTAC
jgi:hypothetical protein